MKSSAEVMFSKKGIAFAKNYATIAEGCTESVLSKCEHGHEHCAQYKNGPCIAEMKALIKASGKKKPAPAKDTCDGELMAYGISPEAA